MTEFFEPHVAILVVDLRIHQANSLKEKRSVILKLRDKLQSKFNVSVAEIGEQDKWQRAIFGVSMISGDKPHLDQCMQKVLELIQSIGGAELLNYQLEYV